MALRAIDVGHRTHRRPPRTRRRHGSLGVLRRRCSPRRAPRRSRSCDRSRAPRRSPTARRERRRWLVHRRRRLLHAVRRLPRRARGGPLSPARRRRPEPPAEHDEETERCSRRRWPRSTTSSARPPVVLEMTKLLAVVDLFVVTSGRCDRQVRTIAEEVERLAKLRCGRGPDPRRGAERRAVGAARLRRRRRPRLRRGDPRLLRPRAPLVRRTAAQVPAAARRAAERR